MKWQRGHRSSHVEDRRGQRLRPAAKLGGGAVILAALAAVVGQALGIDVGRLLGMGGGGPSGAPGATSGAPGATSGAGQGGGIPADQDADRELVEFVHFVIDDIQDSFAARFREAGRTYEPAGLVLFTGATPTGCGEGDASIGPFYCPPDRKAYIDLSFYRVLKDRLGAGGDFAQAYVLAHEIGHHLQTITGTDVEVRAQARREPRRAKELSVRQELQADCYAGVWAHASARRGLVEAGDIAEAVTAAQAIGDDRLQQLAGRKVNPETWTHGSSAQRVRWFERGRASGQLDACDTFAAAEP